MIYKSDFILSLLSPVENWKYVSESMVSILLGEETAVMVGFNQRNPHHCYDLMEHTLHTVDEINLKVREIKTSVDLLRTAAFFHDIGKPNVAMEKENRLVFYGHAKRSSEISEGLLSKLGYTSDEIKLISFYISHHDDFISYVLPTEKYDKDNPYLIEITADNILKHINSKSVQTANYPNIDIWKDLLVLCHADISAQSEIVLMNGLQVDSKEHKLSKIAKIKRILTTI